MDGYDFVADDLATLLLRRFYPERTDRESTIIRDWLLQHGTDYDRYSFSVRVGKGTPVDPTHEPGVQASTAFSSRKRIDILAWQGNNPTIVEVKYRITPASLGQILTYRLLFLEEMPDAPEPKLLVIGRTSDDETTRSLQAHGIDVELYSGAAPQ